MTDQSPETEMRIDPSRAQALASQLSAVRERITAIGTSRTVCTRLTSHM